MTEHTIDLGFCKKIPKVELHAHLNGSISQKTLQKLYQNHENKDNLTFELEDIILTGKQDYSKAFSVFKIIHSLVVSIKHIEIITKDVINEFYDDNVKYLELRSTPKCFLSSKKDDYMQVIVDTIQQCMKKYSDLVVTFLVSIDRGRSLADAEENLDLALKYHVLYPEIVVGIDFSGNPSVGNVKDFIPFLKTAQTHGLKVVPHVGEDENHDENLLILQCEADRVGHAVCIHPSHQGSQQLFIEIRRHNTPIEICLTSNIIGGIVQSFLEHPIKEWYSLKHPIVLCTDDKGVFNTTLSNEYLVAANVLNLNRQELWKLSEQTIEHTGAPDVVKRKLRELWRVMKIQVFDEKL